MMKFLCNTYCTIIGDSCVTICITDVINNNSVTNYANVRTGIIEYPNEENKKSDWFKVTWNFCIFAPLGKNKRMCLGS